MSVGPKFENFILKSLPVDNGENYVRQVKSAIFSRVKPTPVENPRLVCVSESALKLVNISSNESSLVDYLSGNKIWMHSDPVAHCYCGHQFGNFAGQLGDGAAILLGDVKNNEGDRYELQLKGAGKTPFSRFADGRKVFRSSVREFLASEAMHYLDIPSTRAGSLVTSDTRVTRDPFYDGNTILERASIISRIAKSFIRFGSFEICTPMDTMNRGPSIGEYYLLIKLLNYVIREYYPELWREEFNQVDVNSNQDIENLSCKQELVHCYEQFFKELTRRTAQLVSKWNSVGFCHGVLNTDNMSIIGLTIDYGPYGFIEQYHEGYTPNSSDNLGRYSFRNQAKYCHWNLTKLAKSLALAMDLMQTGSLEKLLEISSSFHHLYSEYHNESYLRKLGLYDDDFGRSMNKERLEASLLLIARLKLTMENSGSDFTKTFLVIEYLLNEFRNNLDEINVNSLKDICCDLDSYRATMKPQISQITLEKLLRFKEIDRNQLEQIVGNEILLELDKYEKYNQLSGMRQEEKSSNDFSLWKTWFDEYIQVITKYNLNIDNMIGQMRKSNPRFILRNHLIQDAIHLCEQDGNSSGIDELFVKSKDPFHPKEITEEFLSKLNACPSRRIIVT